ncbi:hypothetical protein CPSG_06293 [Coccidioides posadasii str. Silveira]|uniref:Uncharacterized protein n=1 Tax=Coccidioides posadasii (strain RMSCC 757 / Silveira) TaxID=443226 RepID=E9D8Z1_COCPS|nr:hypothetical protein CPSG_06293 [Coccidioides posadasii str. Silveira]
MCRTQAPSVPARLSSPTTKTKPLSAPLQAHGDLALCSGAQREQRGCATTRRQACVRMGVAWASPTRHPSIERQHSASKQAVSQSLTSWGLLHIYFTRW